jgi:chloramphenicol 3-O-phosphotransferase
MAEILLLSGPPASGKTTVARLLSERYDRVAHVDVNQLLRLRSAGLVRPWVEGPERARQRAVGLRNASALARNFIRDCVGVIIEDLVLPDSLKAYLDELKPIDTRIHFVRLMPSIEACQERNRLRSDERVRPAWLSKVYESFLRAGDFAGVSVDSSDQGQLETADKLQALTTQGASVIWPTPDSPSRATRGPVDAHDH